MEAGRNTHLTAHSLRPETIHPNARGGSRPTDLVAEGCTSTYGAAGEECKSGGARVLQADGRAQSRIRGVFARMMLTAAAHTIGQAVGGSFSTMESKMNDVGRTAIRVGE